MKIKGNCVTGDPVLLDRYTADWMTVRLHPLTFYRRLDLFEKGFKKVKGMYAEIDNGTHVIIRFSEKNDMTEFHRLHHEYI